MKDFQFNYIYHKKLKRINLRLYNPTILINLYRILLIKMNFFPEFIKSIKLDRWYKPPLILSGFILFLSIFYKNKVVPQQSLLLISLGVFLFCIGEFKQDKDITRAENIGFGKGLLMTFKRRTKDFLGILFNLLGIILIVIGVFKLFIDQ